MSQHRNEKWFLRRSGGVDPSRHKLVLHWTGEPTVSIEFAAPESGVRNAEKIDPDEICRQFRLAIEALQLGLRNPPSGESQGF